MQLMCQTPPQIQAQLTEAVAIVAKTDFHKQWTNLLPDLVSQFTSTDNQVVVGTLRTVNTIFKSFRFVSRTDELYEKILYSLQQCQSPLLSLFCSVGQAVENYKNNAEELQVRFEQLRLMCRIFYSLNYQDLPEFFEDHMGEWMAEFAKYLQYENPLLTDPEEEDSPSPIDKLQQAIIESVRLYANKDEETFMNFLPQFTSLVWNRLMNTTPLRKHDGLAVTSIEFLSLLVSKQMHRKLFEEEATLRQIISNIVIPNLTFRESDEETFEDNPHEYMLTEVEGSDSESRRRCSQTLLRDMCRQFESQTTAICADHVSSMLNAYQADPANQWRAKDAAIHLMLGIAVKKESRIGVSEITEGVNIMDFFQNHILNDLRDSNHHHNPVVKSTCIKYVATFRNQFTRDHIVQLMPILISHLASPIVVVHTFACYTIELILSTQETQAGGIPTGFAPMNEGLRPKLDCISLQPFLEPLFGGLFQIIDHPSNNPNDYAMKCVMRTLVTAKAQILSSTQTVVTRLTSALARVAGNPQNPHYNHYLFESIALLIKNACSADAASTAVFEDLLFPSFNKVLQNDIAEFTPYVFQIMAQLLELRPKNSGLGSAYSQLFHPLLTPAIWENHGNVPALSRLIRAYIQQSPSEIKESLIPILGIFQKLVSQSMNRESAFEILDASIMYFPQDVMAPVIGEIFRILITVLQSVGSKPVAKKKYSALVTHFFALFIGLYGPDAFFEVVNKLQQGLTVMILGQVWVPYLSSNPALSRMKRKAHLVGLTKLLCESPVVFSEAGLVWAQSVSAVVAISTSKHLKLLDLDGEKEEIQMDFNSTYSKLTYARKAIEDPFPSVDPAAFFGRALHSQISQNSVQAQALLQQVDPKVPVQVNELLQTIGLSI